MVPVHIERASYELMWEYKICNGKITLTLAAKAGFVENVQMILEKGVYPNTTNYKGESPLLLGTFSVWSGATFANLVLFNRLTVQCIWYSLNGDMMLRLLLSHGYNVEMCLDFMCRGIFGNSFVWPAPEHELIPGWTTSSVKDKQFCEFIAVPWLKHLAGKVVCVFIDYKDYVPLSTRIKFFIETQEE